jgi:hypothetical protein
MIKVYMSRKTKYVSATVLFRDCGWEKWNITGLKQVCDCIKTSVSFYQDLGIWVKL